MAIFNELQTGRFNRALQKLTGIKGGASVKQLGSEILPVFPIPWGIENRYLESWQRFGQAISVAGVAANNSAARLRNPVGSNVIAVIEKITAVNNTGATETFNIEGPTPSSADLAVVASGQNTRFDARGQQQPTCVQSSQNTAPLGSLGNTIYQIVLPGTFAFNDVILTDNTEIPLLPGDAIQFRSGTVNQVLAVNLWWRERFLEDSERF